MVIIGWHYKWDNKDEVVIELEIKEKKMRMTKVRKTKITTLATNNNINVIQEKPIYYTDT